MCGIAGAVGAGGWDGHTIGRVQDRLRHRGPEGEGAWSRGAVSLVHTRLRVIDLSDAGAQPMWTRDGRYGLVYNGEIYNYRSLRKVLRDRGHRFHSESDTEVVLEAWAEWQEGALDRLQGIFAFAIWDRKRGRLTLARDRMGVKPLYWSRNGDGQFVFASELRALLASGAVDPSLETGALPQYLRQQTVAAPATLVRGVEMLRPGHRLSVGLDGGSAGDPEIVGYWDLLDSVGSATPEDVSASPAEAGRELARWLGRAVDRQRVADVPLGAFLSGGLDSTVVVALLSEVADGRVATFTVVSEEAGYVERDHARLVADRFGTDHHEVELSGEQLASSVPDALDAQDHPSADGVNTYIVARAAREAGLTVALSGLGADELFGGYPTFGRLQWMARASPLLRFLPQPVRSGLAASLRGLVGGVRGQKLGALSESDGSVPQAYPILRAVFPPGAAEELLRYGEIPGPRGEISAAQSGWSERLAVELAGRADLSVLERAAHAETTCYMHDVLLRDTDQMSMAHALEVRVPLLDDTVVEHVLSLSSSSRFPASGRKGLLRSALRERVPEEVLARPKRGFTLPFDRWMRGPLLEVCEEGIEVVAQHRAFDAVAVADLWRRFLDGASSVPWHRPWLLTALGRWMDREGIS